MTKPGSLLLAAEGESKPSFDVSLSPRWWGGVSLLRTFTGAFFAPFSDSPGLTSKVELAVHELLENAIKYACSLDSPVRCRGKIAGDRIMLQVENRALEANIKTLRDEFRLVLAGDPLEVYLRMMERSLFNGDKSQLGLARVRYEADAALQLRVVKNRVTIQATFEWPARQGG
ncbi:MAG: histidine kinase [Cyanobacteria bacterium RYN_339]|nr:histidine kinase [Cyanobacteria bacterium RYN_339]